MPLLMVLCWRRLVVNGGSFSRTVTLRDGCRYTAPPKVPPWLDVELHRLLHCSAGTGDE